MTVRNLTPHPITILEGPHAGTYPAPAPHQIARVDDLPWGRPLLPEPSPGVVLIVSLIVAEAAPERSDLVVPGEQIRDDAGRIVGARSLVPAVCQSPALARLRRLVEDLAEHVDAPHTRSGRPSIESVVCSAIEPYRVSPTQLPAIAELLCSLFSGEELLRLAHYELRSDTDLRRLPIQCSQGQAADVVARGLIRLGAREARSLLIAKRPQRADEIRSVFA